MNKFLTMMLALGTAASAAAAGNFGINGTFVDIDQVAIYIDDANNK